MEKKIVIMALALSCLAGNVLAEQSVVNEYRELIKSGNFVLDYEVAYDDYSSLSYLASQNNMRMVRSGFKMKGIMSAFNSGKKDYPDVLYRDGKYYKFQTKKKATMALWNQLKDPNIDPSEGWNAVQYSLAIPDEFTPICAYDAYRGVNNAFGTVQFMGSEKKTIDKKEYDCDKYVLPIKSQTGGTLYEMNYLYCYSNGKLAIIEKSISNKGKTYDTNKIIVNNITGTIPEGLFNIPAGCKVYEVGTGDMNDLIDKPVLVEEY